MSSTIYNKNNSKQYKTYKELTPNDIQRIVRYRKRIGTYWDKFRIFSLIGIIIFILISSYALITFLPIGLILLFLCIIYCFICIHIYTLIDKNYYEKNKHEIYAKNIIK